MRLRRGRRIRLEREDARYLAVLAAQDIRTDRARGLVRIAGRHEAAWEKLQPACEWDKEED